jgi:peptide/nickel transport system permease protein
MMTLNEVSHVMGLKARAILGPTKASKMAGSVGLVAIICALLVLSSVTVGDGRETGPANHVNVTALQDTTPPNANAGPDKSVWQNLQFTFDGSLSNDTESGIASYVWTFVYDNATVTLVGEYAQFTFAIPGIYTVTLNVTDNDGNWATDTMRLTVMADTSRPFAVSSAPIKNGFPGLPIEFNASLSFDSTGQIINYSWSFNDNGPHVLYGKVAYYSFSQIGNYTVVLNVTDTGLNWNRTTIKVYIRADTEKPKMPKMSVLNKTAYVGSRVVLNGNPTTDNSKVIVNYTWSFVYNGSEVQIYGAITGWWFNKSGDYVITFSATDYYGNSNTTTFYVKIKRIPTFLDKNWPWLTFALIIIGFIGYESVTKYKRDHTLLTKTDRDKLSLEIQRLRKIMRLFMATRMGKAGMIIIMVFVAIALYATLLLPPTAVSPQVLARESWQHPFGTDQIGRDVLIRTLHGSVASLIIGFVAMAISMIIGTVYGLASGYWGGWRDEVLMRINDVFLSIPWLVLMIVIAAIWGSQDLFSVIVVIGVTGWSTTARIVRAQVLSLKERMFVERAKAIGSGEWHIIRTHILPNVVPLIFANAILTIAISILSESTLSFLGLGPQDVETWGRVLEDAYAQSAALAGPYLFIIMPGLCIVIVVLGFTFIGYAMDEVLNPKLRKR